MISRRKTSAELHNAVTVRAIGANLFNNATLSDVMAIEFEWETKREEIWDQRGVDILVAARMFNRPEEMQVWEDARQDYGERRAVAIGLVEGVYYELVFTEMPDRIRLITAWKLNEKSKRKAEARHARRAERDARERGTS